MKKNIPVLSALLITLAFSLGARAEEHLSKGYSSLFKIAEGQTPESVAAEYLGSADYADDLLKFNDLKANEFGKAHGGFIAIPGNYFKEAVMNLEAAQQGMAEAIASKSEKYSPIQFQYARSLMQLAEAAFNEAAYDKTRHLAGQAYEESIAGRDTANLKAVVEVPVTVIKTQGEVSLDRGIAGAQPIGSVTALSEGATLTTGNGRALLRFSDGSQVLLFEDSSLSIQGSKTDERFGSNWKHLVLHTGVAEVSATAASTDDSEFILNLGGMEMEIADSRSCSSGFDGNFSLSVFEGTVSRIDEGQHLLRLSAGRGLTLDAEANLQGSEDVAGQPEVLSPVADAITAIQQPIFELAEIPTTGSSVLLEIATDEDFVQTVYVGLAEQATMKTALLAEGKYFWRVRNNRNGLLGQPSETKSLSIVPNLEVNLTFEPAPQLIDGRSVISGRSKIFAAPLHKDTSVLGYEFQLGEGSYIYHAAAFSIEEHGPVTIKVQGVSAEGNYGETDELDVFVDSEAPRAKVTVETEALAASEASQVTLKITANDESGVAAIRYRIADGALQDYSEAVSFEVNADVDVFYEAEDLLGNVSRLRRVRVFTE